MLRIGLALYLVLATAVGPSLCCCLPVRLLAFCTPAERSSSARHAHCCHHAGDREHPSKKTNSTPDNPSPAPHGPCPCKENRSEPLVFTAAGHFSGAEHGRFQETLSWLEAGEFFRAVTLLVPPAQGQATGELIASSLHNPRAILRALHILRC